MHPLAKRFSISFAVCGLLLLGTAILVRLATTKAAIAPCVINLQNIQRIKYQWMFDNKKKSDDRPTWDDLRELIEATGSDMRAVSDGRPHCPGGGTYTIGAVNQLPTCSLGDSERNIFRDHEHRISKSGFIP